MEKAHDPNSPPLDTNIEYISSEGVATQPPVITSVFKSIFVETPKDFFNSIRNFFLRYINLFKDAKKYLRYPTVRSDYFAAKDYKDQCQQTFEFALIVIAILIFMIKMDWITGDEKLKNIYGNDIMQAIVQFMLFVIFAVSYFLLIVLSVLAGRAYRFIFKIPVSKQEGDILFTYLSNAFFLFSSLVALVLRIFVSTKVAIDNIAFQYGVFFFYAAGIGFLSFYWAKKFAVVNSIPPSRRMIFIVIVGLLATAFFSVTSTALTFFIMGV